MTSESKPEALDESMTLLAPSAESLASPGRGPPESALLTHLIHVSTSSIRCLNFFLCLSWAQRRYSMKPWGGCLCVCRRVGQTTLQGVKGEKGSGCHGCTTSLLDPSLLPLMENIVFPRFPRGAGRRQTAELFTTRDGFSWEPDSLRQKVVGRERWWSQSETEGSVASKSQVCVPDTLSTFTGHVQCACGWIFIGKVRWVESTSRGIDTPLQREACNTGRGALGYPGESFRPSWDSEQVHTDLWEAEGIRQHLDYLEKSFHLTFSFSDICSHSLHLLYLLSLAPLPANYPQIQWICDWQGTWLARSARESWPSWFPWRLA